MYPIKVENKVCGFLRENTWDDRALGLKVTEIREAEKIDADFLQRIDELNHSLGARLCCCRWRAEDVEAKSAFFEAGYDLTESSVDFELPLRRFKGRKIFDFVVPQEEHHETLVHIATEQFQFSRFHEDPKIPRDKAAQRYTYWMRELLAQGLVRVALSQEGDVKGFYVGLEEGAHQRLLLAVTTPDIRGLGYFFFSSIFETMKEKGGKLRARVSVANRLACNVYIKAGFSIRESSFDYHKHI